jgi:hypothetical protein
MIYLEKYVIDRYSTKYTSDSWNETFIMQPISFPDTFPPLVSP